MTEIAINMAIVPMQQLADAKNPQDNWTGLKDAAERRKRQNRLNVRAHRRRKAEQLGPQKCKNPHTEGHENLQVGTKQNTYNELLVARVDGHPAPQNLPVWAPSLLHIMNRLFPLPIDQRLLTLVQYNVLRGIATNMSILSLSTVIAENCDRGGGNLILFPAPSVLPESLMPTPLQTVTPHEFWIDLIPSPQMRDNAILLAGTFDKDALCADLVGSLYDGFENSQTENAGMIVWNDPWHFSGWEITEGFAKKWAFLIMGCQELLDATNRWRALRNEEPLVIEVE